MSSIEYEKANTSETPTPDPQTRIVSAWSRFLTTWLLMTFTSLWLGFTIFFAWNSTLANPFIQSLLPSKPSHTITALNLLSHVTVFLLQVLASNVFESLRWVFACTRNGVSSFGFMVMSRATGPLGVLYLLLFNSKTGTFWRGHRLWGLQRFDLSQ